MPSDVMISEVWRQMSDLKRLNLSDVWYQTSDICEQMFDIKEQTWNVWYQL